MRQDLNSEQVAIGCLHLLARRAIVEFPGTTRSHPSPWAIVSLTGTEALQSGWTKTFPFRVPWDLWQYVVIPVLSELLAEGSLSAFMRDATYQEKVNRIQQMLEQGVT